MKTFIFYYFMLAAAALTAQQNYTYTGVVTAQSLDSSMLVIDNVEYKLDYTVSVHQALALPGEKAPKFLEGQVVGFDIDSSTQPAKITDIWVLDNSEIGEHEKE